MAGGGGTATVCLGPLMLVFAVVEHEAVLCCARLRTPTLSRPCTALVSKGGDSGGGEEDLATAEQQVLGVCHEAVLCRARFHHFHFVAIKNIHDGHLGTRCDKDPFKHFSLSDGLNRDIVSRVRDGAEARRQRRFDEGKIS